MIGCSERACACALRRAAQLAMNHRALEKPMLSSLPEDIPLVQARPAREPPRGIACTQRGHGHAQGSETLSRAWSLGQLRGPAFGDWGPLFEEQVSRSDPMDLHSTHCGLGSDYMEVSNHGMIGCPPHAMLLPGIASAIPKRTGPAGAGTQEPR